MASRSLLSKISMSWKSSWWTIDSIPQKSLIMSMLRTEKPSSKEPPNWMSESPMDQLDSRKKKKKQNDKYKLSGLILLSIHIQSTPNHHFLSSYNILITLNIKIVNYKNGLSCINQLIIILDDSVLLIPLNVIYSYLSWYLNFLVLIIGIFYPNPKISLL